MADTAEPHQLFCVPCSERFDTVETYLKHAKVVHIHNRRYPMTCPICARSINGWRNFRRHFSKCKKQYEQVTGAVYSLTTTAVGTQYTASVKQSSHEEDKHDSESDMDVRIQDSDDPENTVAASQDLGAGQSSSRIANTETFCASYALQLKTDHCLSERAISYVVESTRQIVDHAAGISKVSTRPNLAASRSYSQVLSTFQTKVSTLLNNFHPDKDGASPSCSWQTTKEDILNSIQPPKLFHNTDSSYRRACYYEDHLGYIKPVEVEMRDDNANKGYFIPFLVSLEQLVNCPEVQAMLNEPLEQEESFLSDISHGEFIQQSEVMEKPTHLKIIGYYDELEIVNPIGSARKKHALGVFLWQLANIHPKRRSVLNSIQLCAVSKKSAVRSGISYLLDDFIAGLNQLKNGVVMNINGHEKTVQGSLICFIGDTPAAQFVGGFKEGVSFASKKMQGM